MKNAISILLLCAVACFGCGQHEKKVTTNSVDIAQQVVAKKLMTFFDSVAAQMDLTPAQMRHHTVFYKFEASPRQDAITSREGFTGDTIYFVKAKHPLVILTYYDGTGVGMRKLMFIYDAATLSNTAYMEVENDIDIDYSTDDTQKSFKIINDGLFFIETVTTERKNRTSEKTNRQTIEKQYFKITDNGKIEKTGKKTISTQQVDKTEDDL